MTTDKNNFVFAPRKPRGDGRDVVFTSCSRCFPIDTQAIRSKILDLAMRGKLTEQLPEDGTGKELLAKISTSKNGKLRGNKKGMPISFTQPFHLPRGWAWGQLETLGADVPCAFADGPFGSNLKKEHYTTERQVRIIQLSNVGVDGWRNNNEKYTTYDHLETIKRSEVKAGNIVIAKMMPAGRAIVVPEGIADAFVLSSDCVKFVPDPKLDVNFICYAINSNWFHDQVMKDVHGIGRERTSLSNLKRYFLPIPSASEQHRIVARIEQAFSALDTIDTLQAKYADNLAVLKSKLIDAAIQGKLTEQLPEDGTAEELYRHLREKKRDIEDSGILKGRKKKAILPVDDVDFPFPIPATWKWIRLDSVAEIYGRIGFRGYTRNDIVKQGEGAISLSPSNITIDGKCVYDKCTYITWEKYEESPEIIVAEEDLIIVKTGSSYGKCGVVKELPEKATINPQLALLKYILCDRYYLHTVLNSTMARKQYEDFVVGAATPTFSQEDLSNFILPLPPLTEQKRIVERVTELLAVCGEFE